MTDRVGQQLRNYRLIRLLGRGGFAEVYLGEHQRLNTQVAIKVLHTSLEDDEVKSFLREAQIVAHLKHSHIVRVFDFDVENHIPFLVMDYLPNGNVRRSHPKGTPIPLTTIVSYVTQIASALQYAHDEKLIHRDIKPENMLLDRDNTLVLSDFGIALMAQSSRYQSTQEVAGTAAYMAPEQFQGKPRRASDQYALGVVVYEWLSGDRPFHGSFTEIASQHLFVPPPALRDKIPAIPPAVERVVLKALAKNPTERFEQIQLFANALQDASKYSSSRPIYSAHSSSMAQPPRSATETGAIHTQNAASSAHLTDSLHLPGVSETRQPSPQRRSSRKLPRYIRFQPRKNLIFLLLVLLLVIGGSVIWLLQVRPTSINTGTSTSTTQPTLPPQNISVSVAPTLLAPSNGSILAGPSHLTTLQWNAVPNAVSYNVEVYACGNVIYYDPSLSFLGSDQGQIHLTRTSYTFNFQGASYQNRFNQNAFSLTGCWTVWAVGSDGVLGPESALWTFSYRQ